MKIVGLDLGQQQDFTAIAVVVRSGKGPARWEVPHLERLPLGTPYTEVALHVARLLARPELNGARLAVDRTGVGAAVVDVLRSSLPGAMLIPITITSGHVVSTDSRGGYNVPKKDLVGTVQILLQQKRLSVARELALAETLVKELLGFRIRITPAANETFSAWREGNHDDLVLALALALWVGKNCPEIDLGFLDSWLGQEEAAKPRTRLQTILAECGIDLDADW